ncbi:hypothetical protein YC2023_110250 [Brassica napus]
MENLFAKSEIIIYKKIVGGPIFDVYDDGGWIHDEGSGFEVQDLGNWRDAVFLHKILVEINKSDEVSLQKIGFLVVEGKNLAVDTGPGLNTNQSLWIYEHSISGGLRGIMESKVIFSYLENIINGKRRKKKMKLTTIKIRGRIFLTRRE